MDQKQKESLSGLCVGIKSSSRLHSRPAALLTLLILSPLLGSGLFCRVLLPPERGVTTLYVCVPFAYNHPGRLKLGTAHSREHVCKLHAWPTVSGSLGRSFRPLCPRGLRRGAPARVPPVFISPHRGCTHMCESRRARPQLTFATALLSHKNS